MAARRARAEQALARVRGGEDFAAVAREFSEDAQPRARRRASACARRRGCPTCSSRRCATLPAGEVSAEPLRSRRGLSRAEGASSAARRAALRGRRRRAPATSCCAPRRSVSAEVAARRLAEFQRQIEAGAAPLRGRRAPVLARTARRPAGGDLGWVVAGHDGARVRGGDEPRCRRAACRRRWSRASACT
ncbi:MAG: peptidylprolyl isomerase [Comamonadaceae bacterium]|nr:peptidylprolyl isomerase [Comamonadaceae bacterium]